MPDPLMTVTQYEKRLGRTLTGPKRDQAEAFLGDASDEARRIAEGLLDDATHQDVPGAVRLAIFSMTVRAAANPRGLASERVGDYAYTTHTGQTGVWATPDEEDAIRDALGIPAVATVTLSNDLPQRLLDDAAGVPVTTNLGGI